MRQTTAFLVGGPFDNQFATLTVNEHTAKTREVRLALPHFLEKDGEVQCAYYRLVSEEKAPPPLRGTAAVLEFDRYDFSAPSLLAEITKGE